MPPDLPTIIKSSQNSRFKQWRRWASRPEKPDCPFLPVEGWKQVADLCSRQSPGWILTTDRERAVRSGIASAGNRLVELPPALMNKLSSVKSSQGIVGFFSKPNWTTSDLTGQVLYLDRLKDPGNLGTLLRTAAATGCFSLVASEGTVSPFNLKVVRSSSSYLFQVPFLARTSIEHPALADYDIWVLDPHEGELLRKVRFGPNVVFLLGSEADGPEETPSRARRIHIPMEGRVESLNAAVAGSLLMYEAFLQARQ